GGRRRGVRRHGRGGARLLWRLEEVTRPLVEARVHVVARLVDRLATGLHDVILRVALGPEDRADRLAVLVGERDAQVRGVEPVGREVGRGLGGDARAAEVVQVVDEARDGRLLGLLALTAFDRPGIVAAARERRARAAVFALDHDPAHPRLLEGEHHLVAEVVRLLAERARRPVAHAVDRRLAGALGVHQLLRALRALAAEEQRLRLGAVLAGGDRHRQARLAEAVLAEVRRRVVGEVRGAGAAQRREVRSHLRRVGGLVPGLDDPGVLPLPGERGRLAAARDVDALHVVVLEGDELLVAQVLRLLVQAVLQGRRR